MYGYTLNENGAVVHYGSTPDVVDPATYQTDVYSAKAEEYIRRRAPKSKPFYLSIAPLAPHGEAGSCNCAGDDPRAAPRHQGVFASEPVPRPPSFNETDVSDKPADIRNLNPITGPQEDAIDSRYRARLELLRALNRSWMRIGVVRPEERLSDVTRRLVGELAGGRRSFTFRLDDDDALRPDSIARIRERARDVADGTILYFSGPRAAEVAGLPWTGVVPTLIGPELGTASAVKMCTASVYKGTAALYVHAMVTAQRHGVLDAVLNDLTRIEPRDVAKAATKAHRYVGEMHEIAATLPSMGSSVSLPSAISLLTASLSATQAPEIDAVRVPPSA